MIDATRCEYSDLPVGRCAHCQGPSTVVHARDLETVFGRLPEYRNHSRQWAMPIPAVIDCHPTDHRRSDGHNLCRDCEAQLEQMIGDIPALVHDLEIAIRKAVRFTDHGTRHGDGTESPVDFNPAASAALRHLADQFAWTSDDPSKRTVNGSRWALTHWPDLIRRDDIDHVAHRISAAVVESHRVIDRPEDIEYLGPCPIDGCPRDLEAAPSADVVRCECGWSETRPDLEQRVIAAGGDLLLTVDQLVGRVTVNGHPITRAQLERWISREGVPRDTITKPRWVGGMIEAVTVHTYRLGDIRDLALRIETRPAHTTPAVSLAATITTSELAGHLGVTSQRVRQMVAEGKITPVNPASKPYRFHPYTITKTA
jgi:hypothetical protein